VTRPSSELVLGQIDEDAWRRPSLLAVLRLSAVVGTVWLAAVFTAKPDLIRTFFGIADLVLLIAVWTAASGPFPDRTRFTIIETCYFGASVNSILVYGTSPGIPVLLGLFVLVAAIYYDWKGGIAAGIASFLLIVFGAWGWTTGALPVGHIVRPLLPTQYDLWMRTMFAQILAACAITGTVAYILREMRAILFRYHVAEEKFSKAFRTCPDAMVITELESGRFIEVNDSHERLTGFRREEVIGRTSVEIGTFTSVQDRETFAAPLRSKESVRQVERQILDRDGRTIDVTYSAECFDLAGLRCVLTIVQDITARKKTGSVLKENEERFRSFVENASVGIYRSTPAGRIVMANPALLRIMGYDSFQELASRNLETDSFEPSYSRREFREAIERAGHLSGWEAAWKRRDGTTIFVRESASVTRGADGGVQYYDGIIEDISERKMAEQALRESEERFRNLTAAAFEGIVVTVDGRIMDINDQGLKMFGYERAEMLGMQAIDFVSPESRSIVAESIRTQREIVYEHQLLRKDGSQFHAEAQAKMMRMGGRMVRMTALRDITDRRQAEQKQKILEEQLRQMQKMEALGTLAGGIAHDFNNILTGILGNLQIAEMDVPTGHPAFVALQAADRASWRARDLVARILSFSRLEHDNRAPALLGPVVLEAAQLLRVGLPSEIEVRTDIDPNCPPVVFDPGQIHQVIMNLGTNSAHAMRDRGGVLDVRMRPVTPSSALRERHPEVMPGQSVCLTLQDNGCGMEEAVLRRIFEPFYTTKTSGHGTGLGLAMVHAIIKSHNGSIVVESTPASGTRFDIYFPAASGAVADLRPSAHPVRPEKLVAFGNGRRIMLVDDEDAVRIVGVELLERLGFLPSTFAFPAEALEAFRAAPASFSAVISDLTMPEMTGLELARHILAIRPDTPIILTSGYLHTEAQQKARESGVRCVINKPFEVQQLIAQIRSVLDGPSDRGAPPGAPGAERAK
jgi:PAS domain S-box-containing protein